MFLSIALFIIHPLVIKDEPLYKHLKFTSKNVSYFSDIGMKNRTIGSHNMNDCSSRSHTMLTVYITSEQQVSHV